MRKYGFDRCYLLSYIKREIKVTVKNIYVPQYWHFDTSGSPTAHYVGRPFSFDPTPLDILQSDNSSVDMDNFYNDQDSYWFPVNDSALCTKEQLYYKVPEFICVTKAKNDDENSIESLQEEGDESSVKKMTPIKESKVSIDNQLINNPDLSFECNIIHRYVSLF